MKKFKFKLEALLTIRSNKEKVIKTELGLILKDIENIKSENEKINTFIGELYNEHAHIAKGVTGQEIQAYPNHIRGLRANIDKNNNILFSLDKKYQEKLEELKVARAEVKVIEKLKDKKKQEYKKELIKEEFSNIDDLIIMRRGV